MCTFKLTENEEVIKFPEEYFKYSQRCRENKYYFESLNNLFSAHLTVPNSKYKNQVKGLKEKIDRVLDKYDKCDKKDIGDVSGDGTNQVAKEVDLLVMFERIIDFIKLNSEIEKIQIDVIEYLILTSRELFENMSVGSDKHGEYVLNIEHNILMMSAFNHSVNEDRIVNYKIKCKDNQIYKELKKSEFSNYLSFKVRDYNYELEKQREIYKYLREEITKSVGVMAKISNEAKWEEINLEQFKLNKRVTRLTYIAVVIGALGLIIAGISVYITVIQAGGIISVFN